MRKASGRVLAVLAILAAGVLGAGCKANAGDACEKGKAACQDEKTALVCQGGKFIASPCKGANGCAVKDGNMECDLSGNAAGDVCSTDNEGEGQCAADGKSILTCKGGKYAVMACRGPKGCKRDAAKRTSDCDHSVAEIGDACEGGGYTCSVDGKALLQCKDGKAVLDEKCAEGGKCLVKGDKAGCEGGTPAVASGTPAAGAAATPEATVEEATKMTEDLATTLEAVKATCPKVGEAAESWTKEKGAHAKAASAAVDKLPKADQDALKPKFMPRLMAAGKKFEAVKKACAKTAGVGAKVDAAVATLN